MPVAREFVLGVVGGASGVGKTTLLNAISWMDRVNTGDLFKRHMSLGNRDDIRNQNWADFEEGVGQDLLAAIDDRLPQKSGLLIDTHFAAKLNGDTYRIGLHRDQIFRLAKEASRLAAQNGITVKTQIVHVTSEPTLLLTRRRLDESRKRELVPSDCVQALRRNAQCSGQYLYEFARGYNASESQNTSTPKLHHITNSNLRLALSEMVAIFLEPAP